MLKPIYQTTVVFLLFFIGSKGASGQSSGKFIFEGYLLEDTIHEKPLYGVGIKTDNSLAFTDENGYFYMTVQKYDSLNQVKISIDDSLDFIIDLYFDSAWFVINKDFYGFFHVFDMKELWGNGVGSSNYMNSDGDGEPDYLDDYQSYYDEESDTLMSMGMGEDYLSAMPIKQFPTDYPQPSGARCLTWDEFKINGVKNFSKVDNKLSTALNKLDYNSNYYGLKNGFALVTQMEEIRKDGVSLSGPERYTLEIAGPNGFIEYVESLLNAPEGDFRVFVFLVTDVNVSSKQQKTGKVDPQEAMEYAKNGYSHLPSSIASKTFTNEHRVTVLVYHYRKTQGKPMELVVNSLSVKEHLKKSGLFKELQ